MNLKRTWLVVPAALALALSACSGGGSGQSGAASGATGGDNYITANGSEPQNPLIPANTNETGGGHIVDIINSMLVSYKADGTVQNELAESIESDDSQNWTVKIKPGLKFSDGTEIKAKNFIEAWKLATNPDAPMNNVNFFNDIEGTDEEGVGELTGVAEVDDHTFTIKLKTPAADFASRLGYSAYAPLADAALADMEKAGETPIASGPYMLAENGWEHNVKATLVPNPNYEGPRKAKNDGIQFIFYAQLDAAYSDLLAGNLDVLASIPDSAFSTYQDELGERAVNQPAAVFQSFTIPEKMEHFGDDEEGQLRRQAISLAVNREEVTDKIFLGTRVPAKDFTSTVVDGYDANIPGNEVLNYDPEKAKELWKQADAIKPFTGSFQIAYNSDGGHQAWVDATANSIKNALGIDASGAPYPDFKSLRDEVTNRTIKTAFRTGWQGDYPAMYNFLSPIYGTGAGSNDGDYSNPEFDKLLKDAMAAKTPEESNKLLIQAQEILFKDLPAIPLWYSNAVGGYSEAVSNVTFNWKSVAEFQDITKS